MDMPLVCVSLRGCTISEVLKDAASATAAGADLVEVRLDMLWSKKEVLLEEQSDTESTKDNPKIKKNVIFTPQELDYLDLDSVLVSLRQGIVLPVILTCRPKREGGLFSWYRRTKIRGIKKGNRKWR